MKYRLQRVDQVYETPAWWNIGGHAFHETVRWWETALALSDELKSADEAAARFEKEFSNELAAVVLANPNVSTSDYRAARSGTEGRDWWRDHGPNMVADYVTGQAERLTRVYRVDPDALGLELQFLLDVGGVQIKGFIDQVLEHPNGDVEIRDHKTGSTIPDDPLQLQVYALAARRVFGIEAPLWGSYWRARATAKRAAGPTRAVRLDVAEIEPVVRWRLHTMDRAERLSLYPPRPSSFCSACGVRASCPIMGTDPATRRPLELVEVFQ